MGENLVLNMESKGFTVAVYNRTVEKVDAFIAGRGAGKKFIGCHSIQELAASLKRPAQGDAAGESRPAGGRFHRAAHPGAGAGRHHH